MGVLYLLVISLLEKEHTDLVVRVGFIVILSIGCWWLPMFIASFVFLMVSGIVALCLVQGTSLNYLNAAFMLAVPSLIPLLLFGVRGAWRLLKRSR